MDKPKWPRCEGIMSHALPRQETSSLSNLIREFEDFFSRRDKAFIHGHHKTGFHGSGGSPPMTVDSVHRQKSRKRLQMSPYHDIYGLCFAKMVIRAKTRYN